MIGHKSILSYRTPGVANQMTPAVFNVWKRVTERDSVTGPTECRGDCGRLARGLAAVLRGAPAKPGPPLSSAARRRWGDYLGVSYEDNACRIFIFLPDCQGWQWASWWRSCYSGTGPCLRSAVDCGPRAYRTAGARIGAVGNRCGRRDLSPGDLLAPAKDDPRLVPAHRQW